jgi:tetratricopeptide (TPR) repeat protein
LRYTALYVCLLVSAWAASGVYGQDPEAVEHYRTGYDLLKARNFRNASIELERAVAIDSTYGSAFFALGMAYKVLNEYPKAISAYENARTLGTYPDRIGKELAQLYHKSAVSLFEQRKYDDAVGGFKKAIELDPTNARAIYAMGLCYNGLRDETAAAAAFRRASEVDATYAKPLRSLGDLQRRKRDYGSATQAYLRAIEVDSTYMESYNGLAQVKLETKDLEGTAELMQRAVRIDPKFADGYLYLGTALNRLSRHGEAVEPLTQAARLAPRNAEAHYRLGEAQYGKGAYAPAIKAARLAVRHRRNFHAAEVLLGDAHLKMGQTEDAQSWYTMAMQDTRFRDYCRHQLDEIERGPVDE